MVAYPEPGEGGAGRGIDGDDRRGEPAVPHRRRHEARRMAGADLDDPARRGIPENGVSRSRVEPRKPVLVEAGRPRAARDAQEVRAVFLDAGHDVLEAGFGGAEERFDPRIRAGQGRARVAVRDEEAERPPAEEGRETEAEAARPDPEGGSGRTLRAAHGGGGGTGGMVAGIRSRHAFASRARSKSSTTTIAIAKGSSR